MAFGSLLYTSDNDKTKGSTGIEATIDKASIRLVYANHFSNLCKSFFLFGNLRDTMRNDYLNSLLIDYGSFAFVKDSELGIIPTPYDETKKFDLNGNPTEIIATSPPNVDTYLTGKVFKAEDFSIVKLNPQGTPLRNTIMYFCDKIVENQRAIDQNVFSCQTPTVYEVVEGQEKTVTELFNKMSKMVKAIILKRDKGARANELVKILPTPEFKGDKFITNIQYYENELYSFCGFKHVPYEKRERLITAEVNSNNDVLNTTKAMMYRCVQQGINETNEKFGTSFTVDYTLTNRTSNFDIIEQRETNTSDIVRSNITEEGDVINE